MPELPEVEHVRLQLRQAIVGKTIAHVDIFHTKTIQANDDFSPLLEGKIIDSIGRVGKLLIFSFVDENDLFLLAHLKMTGQFFYVDGTDTVVGGGHSLDDKSLMENQWPHKHTRAAFSFSDGTTLYFNDMRLFGYLKVVTRTERDAAVASFGPEPLQDDFDDNTFVQMLQKKKTTIKAALLDQRLIAGLGNIYVDETLWRARIAPTRIAATLSKAEIVLLRHEAKIVLEEAIKAGGTTFRSFADTAGKAGEYVKKLKVFQKQGLPCERCQNTIIKTRVAGRGTHWCPVCQK